MRTLKLLNGQLKIDRDRYPILYYLAILDEELLEHKISHVHKVADGTLYMTAVNIEHDLACLGANVDLQIARDWLNKKTNVNTITGREGYESEDGNTFHFN